MAIFGFGVIELANVVLSTVTRDFIGRLHIDHSAMAWVDFPPALDFVICTNICAVGRTPERTIFFTSSVGKFNFVVGFVTESG
jgi:hypothetical protein